MFVLYAIRNTLSAIRDKGIILHHKSQFLKHLGILMTKNLCNPRLKNPVILSNFSSCFCAFLWLKYPRNLRNPWLIKDLRVRKAPFSLLPYPLSLLRSRMLYNCRDTFTDVMKTLQIKLFMQNKAKFRKVKFNVNRVLTRNYDQLDTWSIRKKQSQTKPNPKRPK